MRQKASADPGCVQCAADGLITISKGRYFFMTALLPVLAALAMGFFADSLFYLFIPPLLATNYLIAGKKAPLIICRSCRFIDKRQMAAVKH